MDRTSASGGASLAERLQQRVDTLKPARAATIRSVIAARQVLVSQRRRGLSWATLAGLLTQEGVAVTEGTLRNYVAMVNKAEAALRAAGNAAPGDDEIHAALRVKTTPADMPGAHRTSLRPPLSDLRKEPPMPAPDATLKLARNYFSPAGRTLDDFADDIITRRTRSDSAVLDTGFLDQVSDPDFAPSGHGKDFPAAATNCAAAIRRSASGEARKRPGSCLAGYDLHYRLMPHWDRKEKFQALGIDPNAVIRDIQERDDNWSNWPFDASWLAMVKGVRHMEFLYQLVVATQQQRIAEGEVAPDEAVDEAFREIDLEIRDTPHLHANDAMTARLRERLEEALNPGAPQPGI